MGAEATIRVSGAPGAISLAELQRLSSEELVTYLKAGHHDALAILFDRHHRLVLSIAKKILRDAAEAEDLLQSVFFELYEKAAQFDPAKGSIKTWIAQYAYHRSLNRRHYLNVRAAFSRHGLDGMDLRELAAGSRPTSGLTEHEARRLIEQSLALLNPRQRETLRMAFFDGLTMAEIAARRGETVVNVRHHYYRGLNHLREMLYGRGDGS